MTDNERKELLLKAKPILFNTEMVRAILDGRKTVTRRVMKNPPPDVPTAKFRTLRDGKAIFEWDCSTNLCERKPPYYPDDILYVRETWRVVEYLDKLSMKFEYEADGKISDFIDFTNDRLKKFLKYISRKTWCPSLFMPKEAARIFLRVTNVRVERLQDIITDDCLTPSNIHKEGVRKPCILCIHPDFDCRDYIKNKACDLVNKYIKLWNSTVKKSDLNRYGWNANPWVWVIEFDVYIK